MCLVLVSGCGSDLPDTFPFSQLETPSEEPLYVGQVPSRSVVRILHERKPFVDALEDHINRPIQFRFEENYGKIIEKMSREHYDLVFLGPFSFVKASRRNSSYQPLVRPRRNGGSTYQSLIITRSSYGIRSISDLSNESFAFVDPNSTSGYLFPLAFMIREYDLSRDQFSRTAFLGTHDEVIRAVASGEFTAGAVYEGSVENLLSSSERDRITVLDRIDSIPNEPIAVRTTLEEDLREKLRSFFLNLDRDRKSDRRILRVLGEDIESFESTNNTDYERVRDVDRALRDRGISP